MLFSYSNFRAAVAALLAVFAATSVEASVLLVEYKFDGVTSLSTSSAASYFDPQVVATDFTPGGSGSAGFKSQVVNGIPNGYFDFGATTSTSESTAPSGSFSVTVAPGMGLLSLSELKFDGRYEGNGAQGTLTLRLVTANFTEDVLINFGSTSAWKSYSLDLSAVPAISGDLFKISVFDHNRGQDAHVSIDNLRLLGAVGPNAESPVPEPASLALLGLGGFGLFGGAIRRRRQSVA